ncbi:MAG TPA: sugar ABC transporter permease, partial [Actinomycetota bacterium]|nr:sugar ABC transporter permease [Actinomycetota bacterium]
MSESVPAASLRRAERRRPLGRTPTERLAYRLLLPVLGVVFVIVLIPLLVALVSSLRADGDGPFVGAQNYARALSNPLLYVALRATGIYALIVLPTEIVLGTALALLVHRSVQSPTVRAMIFVFAIMPIVIPPVGVGVIARLIYAPDYGALNHLLQLAGLIQREIPWLSQPTSAMLSVASVDIWQWTPFVYLVMFAGLQTVPRESVEAAQVDGATWWQQFFRIELFYLRPLLLLVLFLRLADVLRVFDHIFVLTGGGPGTSTQLLSLYLYRVGFKFFNSGEAAALAILV